MGIKDPRNSIGAWAFLIGVILAVIIGLSTSSLLSFASIQNYSPQIYTILVLIGLFVGFSINTQAKDSQTFLIAGVIIVIVSSFGMDGVRGSLIGIGIVEIVSSTFAALLALFAPATIIVALKTVFSLAKV